MSANVFVTLPFLAANGPGAAIDVSAMGATKTIIVGGTFNATVSIEFSTAPAGNFWAPAGSFTNPGRLVIDLAVQRMRAVTSGYHSGAADITMGAPSAPASFVQLTGTSADVSTLPAFKTCFADGACNVEISDDGIEFSQIFSFQNSGGQSGSYVAKFARVTNGVTCWLGGAVQGVPGPIPAAFGQFDPNGVSVPITSQSGQFVNPGVFVGVGLYTIDLVPIPGITTKEQVIPAITAHSLGPALGAADVAFAAGHATITVSIFDSATGLPATDPFYMHVDFISP